MSDAFACLLIHGYLGTPADLAPLADSIPLSGDDALENICLQGHAGRATPAFDEDAFLDQIGAAIDRHRRANRKLILIGHSTGGSLLLGELLRRQRSCRSEDIALLVLCATPPLLDGGYVRRWTEHLDGHGDRQPALHEIGALASLIRRIARQTQLAPGVPVLIVHGEDDELVPPEHMQLWRVEQLGGPLRRSAIAAARHQLFAATGAAQAIDVIVRAIHDARRREQLPAQLPGSLAAQLPGLDAFTSAWPDRLAHLADAPSGRRLMHRPVALAATRDSEPNLANIEITTRCTLGCRACARTQLKLKSRHMPLATFRRVLAALPHAWRIMLVGLGEPLLHPQVLDIIRMAVADGRRTGMVTNAMQLDTSLARALCASGLASLTFSLDAMDPVVADKVRAGSDMDLIRANILGFMAEKRRQGVSAGTSVFTALGADNVGELPAIVDFCLQAGVDALMLTDLNFPANQLGSLHATMQPEQAAVLRQTLRRALAGGMPILSVWGLEEYALERRYPDFLLLDAWQAAQRSRRVMHCVSPWQTLPVNVDGQASVCDCQPRAILGSLLDEPLASVWNGSMMRDQRRRMLSDDPPAACLACPRF